MILGFTFEFYGRLRGGTESYKNDVLYCNEIPLLMLSDSTSFSHFRTRAVIVLNDEIDTLGSRFLWNAGTVRGYYSDFIEDQTMTWTHNISYALWDKLEIDKDIAISITLDTTSYYSKDNEEFYKASFYLNGEMLYSRKL